MLQVSPSDAQKALVSSLCHSPELFGLLPHSFGAGALEDTGARLLYETVRSFWLDNRPVTYDLIRLTLGAHLDSVSLEALWDFVPSAANFDHYLAIVLTHGRLKACINSSKSFLASLLENSDLLDSCSLDDLVENHRRSLARECMGPQELQTIQELIVDFNVWISSASDIQRSSVRFGIEKLDDLLASIQPGDMIVVGGGTGIGKSALALQAAHYSLANMAVVYFSLEMPSRQLIGRLVSNISGVPLSRMLKGKVTSSEVTKISEASERVARMPFWIVDAEHPGPELVRSTIRRLKALEVNVGLVILDYLQLMRSPPPTGREDRREAVVAEFARSMKEIAISENLVVLALSQLNDDGRLRESRAIGQHADCVILINQTGTDTILRLEKHRNGPCGAAVATFEGERFEFRSKSRPSKAEEKSPF